MRLLVQRVSRATVTVEGQVCGAIGAGLLVFLGIAAEDTRSNVDELTSKLVKLRIFEDEAGKMNLDVQQTGGSILVVSQFTLYADTRKGNRPNFMAAARPEVAEPLYRYFVESLTDILGPNRVAEGRFAAMMDVELVNDGPVTIWMDSAQQ
ncbi:MAG: D-tyrosyl-tRNA(Tyr) deacylase [Bacteroidetes bacterium]|nr:D-tyrosyl-tRNA(Tyr) deacylase [Bacteroidota bacterium]